MAFVNKNDYLIGRKPAPYPAGSEVLAVRFAVALVAADLDASDIGEVGILPARCVPVAVLVDSDDLDTNGTPTIVASIGILNADGTALSTATDDGAAVWGSGLTVAQAGGQVQVLSKAISRVNPTNANRKIGILFSAAAATKAAGTIGVTLFYKAA